MRTLLSLAEKVEVAKGPDRELDALIWLAVTPGATREELVIPATDKRRGWTIDETRDANRRLITVPAYTASLEDALALLPQGWGGSIHFSEDRPDCEIHSTVSLGRSYPTNANTFSEVSGRYSSPALALTAAALRARDRDATSDECETVKPCKWCDGGCGWYTSYSGGFARWVPCDHCNYDGLQKVDLRRAALSDSGSDPKGEDPQGLSAEGIAERPREDGASPESTPHA
jgi:hypothetical protein